MIKNRYYKITNGNFAWIGKFLRFDKHKNYRFNISYVKIPIITNKKWKKINSYNVMFFCVMPGYKFKLMNKKMIFIELL